MSVDVGLQDTFGAAACDAEKWGVNFGCMLPSSVASTSASACDLFASPSISRRRFACGDVFARWAPRRHPMPYSFPTGGCSTPNRQRSRARLRDLLKRAVAAIDRARGSLRRDDPERALGGLEAACCSALVSGSTASRATVGASCSPGKTLAA